MVTAAQEIADVHGKAMADELVPTLESFLARGAAAAGMDEETFDWVREGGIVMLGTVARHIDAEDQKVRRK